MSDTKKVQMIRERMLTIYGEACWMGYKVSKKNPFTYHHIIERRNGGGVTMDNGAVLTRIAHDDLNRIEQTRRCYYKALNDLFKELNETRMPPTKEYYMEVYDVLGKASKYVSFSGNYHSNPDFEYLEFIANAPLFTDERSIDYYDDLIIDTGDKEVICICEDETIIPVEYKSKIKKKNRNNKKYHYR